MRYLLFLFLLGQRIFAADCDRFVALHYITSANNQGVVSAYQAFASTGVTARVYPLPIMLKNLHITDDLVREWAVQNIKVVSIGESYSPLLPYLLNHGVAAKAVDLWYHSGSLPDTFMGRAMKEYQAKYSDHLIPGSILDIPLQDNSVKVVIVHMLLNNFQNPEARNKAISEILRVLEPGGVALIADFSGYIYQKAEREFAESLGAYTIEADVKVIDWDPKMHGEYGPDLQNAEVKRAALRFFAFQKNSERLR